MHKLIRKLLNGAKKRFLPELQDFQQIKQLQRVPTKKIDRCGVPKRSCTADSHFGTNPSLLKAKIVLEELSMEALALEKVANSPAKSTTKAPMFL